MIQYVYPFKKASARSFEKADNIFKKMTRKARNLVKESERLTKLVKTLLDEPVLNVEKEASTTLLESLTYLFICELQLGCIEPSAPKSVISRPLKTQFRHLSSIFGTSIFAHIADDVMFSTSTLMF